MAGGKGLLRPIDTSKSIQYSQENNQYVVQMKRRRFPWWILLCLLPLLLFIKCNIDIEVTCVEAQTGNLLDNQEVTLEYTAHFLYNHGEFFANDPISRTQTTDADGKTVFKDMPCSVFSYIFYCLSEKTLTARSECYSEVSQNSNFHFRRKETLTMEPVRADLYVKLLDLYSEDPLPNGYIFYEYYDLGEEKADSAHADASGVVTLRDMPACSTIDFIVGRCEGYYDTIRFNQPNHDLLHPSDTTALRLRPIYDMHFLDIVMCIDLTGSMGTLINTVRENALKFYPDLQKKCESIGKGISGMRLRLIGFRDFESDGINAVFDSGFMMIPNEESQFKAMMNSLNADGGGDEPESGLEALAMAINSDWAFDKRNLCQLIVVWTDASTHDLGGYSQYLNPTYPPDIPTNFKELTEWWENEDAGKMYQDSKRLVIFAPDMNSWTEIGNTWTNTIHYKTKSSGLRDIDYKTIISVIADSL